MIPKLGWNDALRLTAALAMAWGFARPACGQQPADLDLVLRDGRIVRAARVEGALGGRLQAMTAKGAVRIDEGQLLGVLGAPVQDNPLPLALLGGGDVLRGLVAGGDDNGEAFVLQSPNLGQVRVPVDRLACLLCQPRRCSPAELALPDGASECLFVPAALGVDRITGTLHRFGEGGVRFQAAGQDEAAFWPLPDLVGLRIADPEEPPADAQARLLTRGGDRVAVREVRFLGDECSFLLEDGGERRLAFADLCGLWPERSDVAPFPALSPVRVLERGFDGDVLLPWRRDENVLGAPLQAKGRTWPRGLGVHSRSSLEFEAPAGTEAMLAFVAFDDSALQLPVRGPVEVAVRVGDQAVLAWTELRAGQEPIRIGPVAVRPGDRIALEVDFGQGRDLGDRVDWLLPVFLLGK